MAQASPRGTFLKIADVLRQQIESGEITEKLPSKAELKRTYSVGESTVERALDVLKSDGTVESFRGGGVFVAGTGDRRPVAERVLDVLRSGDVKVGEPFPTEENLCAQVAASRGPVRTAIAQLEGRGLIGMGPNGRRVVLALPAGRKDEAS